METESLKEFLTVDKFSLDDEVVRQASLYQRVSDAWAEAVAERDALKEQLAYVYAALDVEVRRELGDKATEGRVKAKILLMADHQEATENYLQAKLKADKLNGLKESFEQRSKMIEILSKLFLSGYYGSTAVRATPVMEDAVYAQRRGKMAQGRKDG